MRHPFPSSARLTVLPFCSEVRPVPDHQEIFVNNSKDLESRNSVVISLCEAVTNDTKSDHEALVFHIIDQLDDEGPCLAMCETVPVSMEKFPYVPLLPQIPSFERKKEH